MKNLFFISAILIASVSFSQNDGNEENRSKNSVQDSLMSNTYHLEKFKEKKVEPVSKSNMFQDPEGDTTWKDYERDLEGNIIYDKEPGNNGKVKWQDASYWSSREKQGMWEVTKLPYVSEDDVFWGTRITREIMIHEPSNKSLKYPRQVAYDDHKGPGISETYDEVFAGLDARKNLITILMEAALTRQVNVYNANLSRQYSNQEIVGSHTLEEVPNDEDIISEGIFNYTFLKNIIIPAASEWEDDEVIKKPVLMSLDADKIHSYIIVEDWFFDKRRSKMDSRIISITPVFKFSVEVLDEFGDIVEKPKTKMSGTFFYPEIRKLLTNHKIYNSQNMMSRMSFDEFFQRRLFSSYIIKESNVGDFAIADYIKESDKLNQLLEGERMKEQIRAFEHNAWEY